MNIKVKAIIAIILFILIVNALYIVDEREQVIITQFGKPVGDAIKKAGLHIKTPFIQKVHYFDKRLLEWDGEKKQIPTADKRYIWLDTFARWRIEEPLTFYETVRMENFAHSRLDDIIGGISRDVITENKLIEIVRSTNRDLEFTDEYVKSTLPDARKDSIDTGRRIIADEISKLANKKARAYGIIIEDVKFKRINYVKDVREKVYDRMISERNKIAAKYRSEGKGESAEILGKMRKELDEIQSSAFKKAEEIKGQADGEAIEIYANSYERDPGFYRFLKTLETLEKTIDKKNTLILSTESDFYKYLKEIR